jgi:hypothetical protein
MRIALGDIHGRSYWKGYLREDFTDYYITGDYFDSFNIPFAKQYRNFEELCKAAREDPRIKLCLGNHDYHYLGGIKPQRYSGFQEKKYGYINEILEQNIDLLKIIYVTHDRCLISHAGLSNTFMHKMKKRGLSAVEDLNTAFLRDRNILSFAGTDIYGNDPTQSPIWIRPGSLLGDPVPGYHQIVGHTQMEAIREFVLDPEDNSNTARRFVFIDTGDLDTIYRF